MQSRMPTNTRHAPSQRRRVDQPTPGYFKLRLVKLGWMVPARIVRAGRDWYGIVDGACGPRVGDPFLSPQIVSIHTGGAVIAESEYVWLEALKAWAREHDSSHPCLHPRIPIDPMALRPMEPLRNE
jgi:hypothetical protein